MDMYSLREVFSTSLAKTNSLDDALNQCISEAYKLGMKEAGGIIIYTDGYNDTYIPKGINNG